MDLAAPHDEVLAQKDQANTGFLLHGYGLVEETKTAWEAVLGICRGGKGPQVRASGRERVTRRGEVVLIKTSCASCRRFNLWFVGSNVKITANEGLYPSPERAFSPLLPLGNPPIRRLTSNLWPERALRFAATLLNPGENEMTFTVPSGDLQSVVWDYLRLELADPQLAISRWSCGVFAAFGWSRRDPGN